MMKLAEVEDGLSIVHGQPLAEEEGLGALTLGGFLNEVAAMFGPNEAAVLREGETVTRWTYSDFLANSQRVAKALIACGIGKGTRVGVLVTNRLEFLSGVFGTALAGGVATPISTFFTPTELDEVLVASACSIVLLERKVLKKDFAEMLIGLEPQIASAKPGEVASTRYPFLRYLAVIDSDDGVGAIEGWSQFLGRGNDVSDERLAAHTAAVAPSDPGLLMFSSGSTGKVKGILSAHRGPCLQLWRWSKWYNLQEPTRIWSANGFFWSGNFSQALGGSLSTGGTLVLQRWFDPEDALNIMDREKVTMAIAWPHQWAQFEAAANWDKVDLSSLHYVDSVCALAKHPTVSTDWEEPRWAYGNTETFTLISVLRSGLPPEVTGKSHGVPTGGSTIKIVDPLSGKTMPIGERGEIAVKGPTLMLGYLGIPLDQTLDSEGFLRTSDGGYVDEAGRLFWEGRLNDIIKTGGANVSPLEIDMAIRHAPGVKVSQTVGIPDDLLGEMVVTCIVPHEGATLTEEEIRSFAKQSLASYKIPRRVLFVAESDLNTTGSSKIKTAELRKFVAERFAAELS